METLGLMEILLAAIIYFDLARKEKDSDFNYPHVTL